MTSMFGWKAGTPDSDNPVEGHPGCALHISWQGGHTKHNT